MPVIAGLCYGHDTLPRVLTERLRHKNPTANQVSLDFRLLRQRSRGQHTAKRYCACIYYVVWDGVHM
jgi:hypothetical protein